MSENVMSPPEMPEFSDFDLEFGAFLNRYTRNSSPELTAAGMLLTRELRNGLPRLDLNRFAGKAVTLSSGRTVTLPAPAVWVKLLTSPEMGGAIVPFEADDGKALLVTVNDHILMLRRYAVFEQAVARQLSSRRRLREKLVCDFESGGDMVQDLAVFMALNSKLTILTGGPGTGKTTVCGRIIRELLRRDPKLNIIFAAPTGKAQQRLASQISESADLLEAGTLEHAAMKAISGATIHSFLYNRSWQEKLAFCDLFIIDECSMIPLELFSQIFKLLPENCALILAGDRQLAPVESGTVFADLCCSGQANYLSPEAAEVFNRTFGGEVKSFELGEGGNYSGFIVELQTNYRSKTAPTICRLAEMLRDESAEISGVVNEIVSSSADDYRFVTLDKDNFSSELRKKCRILLPLPKLCASGDPEDIKQALKLSEEFHFLCAVNQGKRGCSEVNKMILQELGIAPRVPGAWKPGTILLITVNDYQLNLRNGDIGIVTGELDDEGKKQLFCRFQSAPEQRFMLGMLPKHECGFAITVHKAQGSGYGEAVVILPGYKSDVLQRKLVYTGITRAAKRLELWGTPGELTFALENTETASVNLFQNT